MTPEFIRDELFRPFATTKGGGHGIGAYQARELLREAGGDLLVLSRKPGGTTMRLLLPSVRLAVADTPRHCRPDGSPWQQSRSCWSSRMMKACARNIAGRFPSAR